MLKLPERSTYLMKGRWITFPIIENLIEVNLYVAGAGADSADAQQPGDILKRGCLKVPGCFTSHGLPYTKLKLNLFYVNDRKCLVMITVKNNLKKFAKMSGK